MCRVLIIDSDGIKNDRSKNVLIKRESTNADPTITSKSIKKATKTFFLKRLHLDAGLRGAFLLGLRNCPRFVMV
jgi:hypothetical protein